MKVIASVTCEDLEVDVDPWEVVSALLEKREESLGWRSSISRIFELLKVMPDSFIGEFDEKTRTNIYNALTEQANRWKMQEE